jgi:hypothetical protein
MFIYFCRRSNTTLTGPLRPNKMGENVHPNMVNGASKRKAPITPPSTQQSTTRLRIPAPPPPLPVKRRIGEEATDDGQSPKKDGQNGSKLLLGGKVDGKGGQQGFHPFHIKSHYSAFSNSLTRKMRFTNIKSVPSSNLSSSKIRLSPKNERA